MPHQLSEAASTYVSSGLLASCKTVLYLTQAAALVSRKMVLEKKEKKKKNSGKDKLSGRGKQKRKERENEWKGGEQRVRGKRNINDLNGERTSYRQKAYTKNSQYCNLLSLQDDD